MGEGRPRIKIERPQSKPSKQAEPQEPAETTEKTSALSRRNLLKAGLGAATIGALPFIKETVQKDIRNSERLHGLSKEDALKEKNRQEQEELNVELEHSKPETFFTGEAEGEHVSDLESMYLKGYGGGIHTLEDKLSVNGARAFNALYEKKLKLLAKHGKKNPNIESEAIERSLDYVRRWNHPEKFASVLTKEKRTEALGQTTLEKVLMDVEKKISPMRSALSDPHYENASQMRASLEYAYGLHSEEDIATARALMRRISTRMMLAYSMTELLSGTKGERNIKVYDLMLRTVGKEFEAGIPSEGDLVESLGQYQMTPFGIKDTSSDTDSFEDQNIVRNGASRPNALLPDKLQLPKTLKDLHSYEDHAAIAFLFAINILASTVKGIPQPQLKTFREMSDTTLMSFIATSHNNPKHARDAMFAWLRSVHAGNTEHSYRDYCDHMIRLYADKSIANFDALDPDSKALAEVEHRIVTAPRDEKDLSAAIKKMPMRGEGKTAKTKHTTPKHKH